MRVLSLFDGMSCGNMALKKLGLTDYSYHASEIDKHAMSVAKDNFPDMIHIGDVTKVDFTQYEGRVDLLMGGSPCQGFSFAGKKLNFEDPRSKLFFDYVRALQEVKPKYFLLENVKMDQTSMDVITEMLGVEPIEINSALVSAQSRRRLYWTNIPGLEQPEDRHIYLKDILEENPENPVYLSNETRDRFLGYGVPFLEGTEKKARCLSAMEYIKNGKQGKYLKCFNYSSSGRGNGKVEGRASEAHKALTLTATGYTQRGFTGVIQVNPSTEAGGKQPYNQNRVYSGEGKAPALTAAFAGRTNVLESDVDFRIRKLTVLECKRLQTVPDDYKMNVSNSQAYKMLGNGWTVDVIAHILKGIFYAMDEIPYDIAVGAL